MDDNYDELDNLLFDYFDRNKDIPKKITHTIDDTLYYINEKSNANNNILKKIACFILILMSCSGVIFAKDIGMLIKNIFVDNNDGVNKAIENGYYEHYQEITSESNGTNVSAEYVLMDENVLKITFNISMEEKYKKIDFDKIFIPDMIIIDEEGNLLFSEEYNPESFENGYSSTIIENNDENVKLAYSIESEKFPKSKKLYVKFSKIILLKYENLMSNNENIKKSYNEIIKNNTLATIFGDWKLEFELPEKFYDRNEINYSIINNDKDIILNKACLTNTGFIFEIQTTDKKVLANINSEEMPIIENENNNKFTSSSGEKEILDSGIITYKHTFNITRFDATKTLKVNIPLNDGNVLCIELEQN